MGIVEFRDGEREVPDHLAALMNDLETYKMTFEEARVLADQRLLRDVLRKKQEALVSEHFRNWRR
jgi:hypothetical protein